MNGRGVQNAQMQGPASHGTAETAPRQGSLMLAEGDMSTDGLNRV